MSENTNQPQPKADNSPKAKPIQKPPTFQHNNFSNFRNKKFPMPTIPRGVR